MGRHETVHTESDHYSPSVLLGIDKLLSVGMETVACRRSVGCLRLIPTISVHLVTDALTL